jgi:hypothetical protein
MLLMSGMTFYEPVSKASTFIRVISDPGGDGGRGGVVDPNLPRRKVKSYVTGLYCLTPSLKYPLNFV